MANTTATHAKSIHGTNPQFLIEKITRMKIYDSLYWKEHCFALTATGIVDKGVALQYISGSYGGLRKPSNFICLVLKLLQIQPKDDIILTFIQQNDYKLLKIYLQKRVSILKYIYIYIL